MVPLWQGKEVYSLVTTSGGRSPGGTCYSSVEVGVPGLDMAPTDPAMVASGPPGNSGSPNSLLELPLTHLNRDGRGISIPLSDGGRPSPPLQGHGGRRGASYQPAGMKVAASYFTFKDTTLVSGFGGLITAQRKGKSRLSLGLCWWG